jgi:hypothetical protein
MYYKMDRERSTFTESDQIKFLIDIGLCCLRSNINVVAWFVPLVRVQNLAVAWKSGALLILMSNFNKKIETRIQQNSISVITSLNQWRHCIAFYMTELRICGPDSRNLSVIYHFYFIFTLTRPLVLIWMSVWPNIFYEPF